MTIRRPVPRVAAVHDLSGFGRTSLTAIMPILSTLGVQVCPLPTAILSTHTGGFSDYHFVDLSAELPAMLSHWKSLGLEFDAIYSGFLGSAAQCKMVSHLIRDFGGEQVLVVVDPVMGDGGQRYATMGPEMVEAMRELVAEADLITPNFTEAALLLGEEYRHELEPAQVKDWLLRLGELGPRTVVITSMPVAGRADLSSVVAHEREDDRFWRVDCTYLPASYPGTGDCFASVLVGSLLQGDSLPIALDRAVQFVSTAIRASFGYPNPAREGVVLERVLDTLRAPVTGSSFSIMD